MGPLPSSLGDTNSQINFDASPIMSKIAIIGAGITGVTTAFALRERGHKVTVFDRHRYAAMETSYANGGQLSASNAEVWNSWSTVRKGLGWLLHSNAPLLLSLKPSWHKYSWLTEFLLAITRHEKNSIETTRLAIEARRHLLRMAETASVDFDIETRGILHVYHEAKDFAQAAQSNRLLQAGGLERRPVTPEEIRSIEPALTGSYHGGFYTPSDFTGDIHKFVTGLTAYLVRQGVRFVFGVDAEVTARPGERIRVGWSEDPAKEASGFAPEENFDAVVICAGVESRQLAAALGDRVNIYPVKGYSITVQLDAEQDRVAAPRVSLLDERAKIVTSRLGDDRFRVAGTAEINGYNRDIRVDRVRPLTEWVERNFPRVSTRRVVPWSGLRPMTPDMMPRVGPGSRKGVYYNTGHGHLGWTLSAATAEMVAMQIGGAE